MFKLTIGPGATKLSLQYAQESQQATKDSLHKDSSHVISDKCQTCTHKYFHLKSGDSQVMSY